MRDEVASCPWCEGKSFPHKSHHPYFSYSVKCTQCGAQGPEVKFDPNVPRHMHYSDYVEPIIVEAISRWNEHVTKHELPTQVVVLDKVGAA